MKKNSPQYNRQHGAVLLVALVMLLLLTIIGITSMRGTSLQERMAANLRESNIAFQAAEEALRQAEREIENIFWEEKTCFDLVNKGEDLLECSSNQPSQPIAFSVTKLNDMPCPTITNCQPGGFFEIKGFGYGHDDTLLVELTSTYLIFE